MARRTSPGVMPYFSAARQVDLHLDGRLLDDLLDRRTDHAGHVGDERANLLGLGGQFGQIGAVQAHDERVGGAGLRGPDPVLGVRQHLAAQPRITAHHTFDLVHRRLVVGGIGRALTHISPELTLPDWSAIRARPRWEPTSLDPGDPAQLRGCRSR